MPDTSLVVDRLIGSGAAGAVYAVHDAGSPKGRLLALKVLKDLSPLSMANFDREVLFLSRLRHPGLVEIHGFAKTGEAVDGIAAGPCYWMDLIDGSPIDAAASGVKVATITAWLRQCLEALDYLHTQGVLHGDLKPANILIDQDRSVRLVDFGLASLTSAGGDTGKLRGSLPYLAPECLKQQRSPASDLYALGTVFHEAVARRHPRGNTGNLRDLLSPVFLRLENSGLKIPSRLARILDRMIETDLSVRFKSARDILDCLTSDEPLPETAFVAQEPFLMSGRDREWSEAVAFVERRGNQGGILLIRGITGTGKSRFARELYFHIALQGFSARRRSEAETPTAADRHELYESLVHKDTPPVYLICEINDDRIDAIASDFYTELMRVDGVCPIVLSPEGFQDETRLAGPEAEAILKARLARIDPSDLPLFNGIAVADGPVPIAALSFVASLTPLAVSLSLNRLGALGLVRSVGDESVRSSHPDLARLILDRLSPAERDQWHRRWIDYWEATREIVPLAHHALEVASHAKKWSWARQAAAALERRGEFPQAVDIYEKALSLNPPAGEKEALLRGQSNVLGAEGDFRASLRALETWHREFPKDPQGLNPVKYWLATGVAFQNLGDPAEARRRFEQCIAVGDPKIEEHCPRLARAHGLLALLDVSEERPDDAQHHFESARSLLLDPSEQKAEVFLNEARLEARLKRWDRILLALDESEAIALQIGSNRGLFAAALERGNLAMRLDHLEEAESAYAKALEVASQTDDLFLLARVHQNRGVLAGRRDQWDHALAELDKARRLYVFFGTPFERGLNLLQLALTRASLGQFSEARALFDRARSLSDAPEFLTRRKEVEAEIAALESGVVDGDEAAARERLLTTHDRLPDPLKLSFEERPDYRRLVRGEAGLKTRQGGIDMDILNQLGGIMRDLLRSSNVEEILPRILEGAMQLSRAERGFLVGLNEDVRAARNLSKEFLKGDEFRLSLTAVRKAIENGEPVVTDNAALDPRFKNAASVQEMDLKSICVLPLKTADGVVGVLYLDHPYEDQIFQGADLGHLQMFADQAAMAFQKTQTIEEMSGEIVTLKKEVEGQRFKLTHEYGEIVGQSRPMMEVLSLVDRLIDTSIPVWIFGESGTGKEMIARALHFKGPRARKPFVSENCSSLPEQLLESELFGHKRGAFTHADRDKKGLLQHADGGTVFLDEIADMSPAMQSKMLRFLQEGEIRPLGSNEIIKVDVRVVSASNKDLNALIKEKKFREDLFYRLNGMTVLLPPLRKRVEDIPILVQYFLNKFAQADKKEPLEIVPEALEILTDYTWPGNVRELENTLRSASLFHYKGKLLPKSFHFKKELDDGGVELAAQAPTSGAKAKAGSQEDEKVLLLRALKESGFHKGEAAEALGISRRYLYTQLAKHKIPMKRISMKAYVERELTGK